MATKHQSKDLGGKPDPRLAMTLDLVSGSATDRPHLTLPVGFADSLSLPLDLGEAVATEILASGGMGITFLGHMASDGQSVAIKIPLNADENLRKRFANEARLLAELNHPKIVRFVATGEAAIFLDDAERKIPWLAMEFIPGLSLRAALSRHGSLPWAEVSRLLEDLLEALEYLHASNLCHLDIKPDNLIHDPETDSWKLVDFGIAKDLIESLCLTLTQAESNPGAWDYMSPEQLSGQAVDIRSDIYSLGKTAWEALIGEVPRVGTPYPSAFLGPDRVPKDVDLLIRKMVEHLPDLRYQTPGAALNALRSGAGVIATKEAIRKTWKSVRKVLAVAASVFALALSGWVWGDQSATTRAKEMVNEIKPGPAAATLRLRKLDEFRRHHQYWGLKYADAESAKLKPVAQKELDELKQTHREILAELEDPTKDDGFRLTRCQNFCVVYKEAFETLPEYAEILSKKEILEARNVSAKARELAAEGKSPEALRLLDDYKTGLTIPEALMIVGDARNTIARELAKIDLEEIERLIQSTKEEDLLSAQSKAAQLEKLIGPAPETQSALKRVDDFLFLSAQNTAYEHLERQEFNAARKTLNRYLELSEIKAHKPEILEAIQETTHAEDDHDWSNLSASAIKNLGQHAYPLAKQDYENYLKKWSEGRHAEKARQGIENVGVSHIEYLQQIPIEDYDSFSEAFDEFIQIEPPYPGHREKLQTLRRWLVEHCRAEIFRLYEEVRNKKIQPQTALDRLGKLDWLRSGEPSHRQWLDELADRLRGFINVVSSEEDIVRINATCAFFHSLERPPADLKELKSNLTVFKVTVKKVDVSLSTALYNKIKGANKANPGIRINLNRRNESGRHSRVAKLFYKQGPVNQPSFELPIDKTFWYDSELYLIDTEIWDDDFWGGGYRCGVYWNLDFNNQQPRDHKFEGDAEKDIEVGTSITIHYSLE